MGKREIIIVDSSHDCHELKWENASNVFSLIPGIEQEELIIITIVIVTSGSASIE